MGRQSGERSEEAKGAVVIQRVKIEERRGEEGAVGGGRVNVQSGNTWE